MVVDDQQGFPTRNPNVLLVVGIWRASEHFHVHFACGAFIEKHVIRSTASVVDVKV